MGPGMVSRLWGTRNSSPEAGIVPLEGFMGSFGLRSWSERPGTKGKFQEQWDTNGALGIEQKAGFAI